jgi:hypothetical protein
MGQNWRIAQTFVEESASLEEKSGPDATERKQDVVSINTCLPSPTLPNQATCPAMYKAPERKPYHRFRIQLLLIEWHRFCQGYEREKGQF